MLNTTQMQTLAGALRASVDATVVAALALRNDVALAAWCNAASAQDCWREDVGGSDLFQETDVAKFDNLTAGKRDAWRLMLTYAPVNFGKLKNRKAVQDVWGVADSVAVLQAVTRKATNAEQIFGGVDATTNTVTAWKLTVPGNVSIDDVSNSLNRY